MISYATEMECDSSCFATTLLIGLLYIFNDLIVLSVESSSLKGEDFVTTKLHEMSSQKGV